MCTPKRIEHFNNQALTSALSDNTTLHLRYRIANIYRYFSYFIIRYYLRDKKTEIISKPEPNNQNAAGTGTAEGIISPPVI